MLNRSPGVPVSILRREAPSTKDISGPFLTYSSALVSPRSSLTLFVSSSLLELLLLKLFFLLIFSPPVSYTHMPRSALSSLLFASAFKASTSPSPRPTTCLPSPLYLYPSPFSSDTPAMHVSISEIRSMVLYSAGYSSFSFLGKY